MTTKGQLVVDLDHTRILLDFDAGCYVALEGGSASSWDALVQGLPVSVAAGRLSTDCDISYDQALADMNVASGQLRAAQKQRAPAAPEMAPQSPRTLPSLRAIRSLKPAQLATCMWVLALVVALEFRLRVQSVPKIARKYGIRLSFPATEFPATEFAATPTVKEPAQLPARESKDVALALGTLARWPFGDTCLRRALVIGRMLRKHKPVLQIGMQRNDEGFVAHAWLELPQGTVGYEDGFRQFAPLGSQR